MAAPKTRTVVYFLGIIAIIAVVYVARRLSDQNLLEDMNLSPLRELSEHEAAGNNIMFTIRATTKLHKERLRYTYNTWLKIANGSNIFLVTDGADKVYQEKSKKLGIHYVVPTACTRRKGMDYGREMFCCRLGEELALAYKPKNKHFDWICHIDDDIYVIMKSLIKTFAKFDPRTTPVYMGRAGTFWGKWLSQKQTLIKNRKRFYFAVGGMICLSRAMLDKIKPWVRNGPTMVSTCNKLQEPDDVTLGAVVELLAKEKMYKTKLFHHHGVVLSEEVKPETLEDQIAFSYGCGQLCDNKKLKFNAIGVPGARFDYERDPSRFFSLHCYLHPREQLCNKI